MQGAARDGILTFFTGAKARSCQMAAGWVSQIPDCRMLCFHGDAASKRDLEATRTFGFNGPMKCRVSKGYQVASPQSTSSATGFSIGSRDEGSWVCLCGPATVPLFVVTLFLMFLGVSRPHGEAVRRVQEGFGLIAHWPFDHDYSSTVNNKLYQGKPIGGASVRITRDPAHVRRGGGALRIDSHAGTGSPAFVSIRNPLFGRHNAEVFTVVGWYRFEDLSGDGSDERNFVWETRPGYSLAFGLRDAEGKRDAEWWFQTGGHQTISDTTGPLIEPGQWHHTAMVWNQPRGHCLFYHDGVLRDKVSLSREDALEEMSGFHIGNHREGNGRRDWDGYLDDMAVFDLELTVTQVRALVQGRHRGEPVHAGNLLELVPPTGSQVMVARTADFKAPVPLWNGMRSQGPLVGHLSDHSAVVWARVPVEGTYALEIAARQDGPPIMRSHVKASETEDWCLRWELTGLSADTPYHYRILRGSEVLWEGADHHFRTAPDPAEPSRVTLAFGSCASYQASPIWTRIRQEGADGMVLLGDTPYIDTTDLVRVQDAYRRFASITTFSDTMRSMPFWGTWDDHDFGRNDADGTLPGKENARRGFVQYRPNASFGHDDQGVYTKFRHGPVEVFLLDTRWFARTEPSWADPGKLGLLGARQWAWLQAGLLASDASFKVLACGMIWDDKKNTESDDWGTYMHERQALQTWLGEQGIEGVILVGGDIHVSRLLKYETSEQVGYPLYQCIVSPMHGSVIPSLNVPHPALVHAAEEPFVFMKLTADTTVEPATLSALWMNRDGKVIFDLQTNRAELSRGP
jgi:alkaline phosphatase D